MPEVDAAALAAIPEPSPPAVTAGGDEIEQRERSEFARAGAEERKKNAEAADAELSVELRKKFANRIFWLVVGWLIGLALLLAAQGFRDRLGFSGLSDAVLIAVITGTTANILGLFAIVAWNVFPKR